ncbi:MAG: hypothetical protein AAFP19_04645 [Bacteroidota bacterium]
MSYLFKHLEHFLYLKEIDAHTLEKDLHLIRAYRKRNLSIDLEQKTRQLKIKLDQQPLRNAYYYHTKQEVQWEEHLVLSTQSPSEVSKLLEMTQATDLEYLHLKLKQACMLSAHGAVYQAEDMPDFLTLLAPLLAASAAWLALPSIAIYHHCFLMMQQREEEHNFALFKTLLFRHGQLFSKVEVRDLYLMAINFCVRKANQNNEQYLYELFDLYKEGLQKEVLLENGILSRFTYHNAIGAGLRTHNYDWTERLIVDYKNTLDKKYRESSYSFNLARLEYSRKNYDKALTLLQKSNYRDLLLNLAAKTLLLKIYFELQEFDLLDSHLEAMLKFIRRKRVIGYHKTNYLNIIHYTKKIVGLNFYDKEAVHTIKEQLHREKILTEKTWLIQQI